jgi:hypothetical protein
MRQVIVRRKDKDGLTQRKKDERSGVGVCLTVWQKGRGEESHVWVVSVTGNQREKSERVIKEQGKGSEWVSGEWGERSERVPGEWGERNK